MENILEETKFIMKKYNIKANKSLGQNFLINGEVVETIVKSANINKDDLVIEIGPGLGTLTKFLLQEAKKVICVELDKIMTAQSWCLSITLIKNSGSDILKLDLKELIKENKSEVNNVKIVANLPYYITTPIVMKLLEDNLEIESITIMIQKEVADRLIETPGGKNTGAITYAINYYSVPEGIMEVPNSSFIPEPEVTSKVLKLNIRKEPPVKVNDENLMFRIIKSAFMQRRKTLLNALVNNNVFTSKEEGIKILNKLNMDVNIRGEKLTLQDFANLANILNDM